jgi:hypothetical protein
MKLSQEAELVETGGCGMNDNALIQFAGQAIPVLIAALIWLTDKGMRATRTARGFCHADTSPYYQHGGWFELAGELAVPLQCDVDLRTFIPHRP